MTDLRPSRLLGAFLLLYSACNQVQAQVSTQSSAAFEAAYRIFSSRNSSNQSLAVGDQFLKKNFLLLSNCSAKSGGVTYDMLACTFASIDNLEKYFHTEFPKEDHEFYSTLQQNIRNTCTKWAHPYEGSSNSLIYTDCINARLTAEIIKNNHREQNIQSIFEKMAANRKSKNDVKNILEKIKLTCATDKNILFPEENGDYDICVEMKIIDQIMKFIK